jgi:hypothetical protein
VLAGIATLRAKGVSWKRIAAQMEVWGRYDLPRHPRGFQDSEKVFEPSLTLPLAFVDLPPTCNLR